MTHCFRESLSTPHAGNNSKEWLIKNTEKAAGGNHVVSHRTKTEKEIVTVKTIRKIPTILFGQVKKKHHNVIVTGMSGWEKQSYDLLRETRGHSSGSKQAWGDGATVRGRPQRGHTVECSGSRVTYCYTVLSPVKSIYIHAGDGGNMPLTSDIYVCVKVRKGWKWWLVSKSTLNFIYR